ncbi:hypothetical protein HNQ59_001775 [Chitinivorax tropicus]|uniref:TonB-dependent receptor n=1 Tax=Chitinivorax tropicus TaxID=714531 RepID=A0A840MPT1_9PROT|nr:hypothetical protein [Chitinivorax tropicus]MBB5018486.1 hypothetical protein [Chitinivorax tropicus]
MPRKWPYSALPTNLARYALQVTAIPGLNNRLGRQVPCSITLGADHCVPDKPLAWGTSFNYVKQSPVRLSAYEQADAGNQRDLDVYAWWKVTPKLRLRLVASNLLKHDEHRERRFVSNKWSRAGHTVVSRASLEMKC